MYYDIFHLVRYRNGLLSSSSTQFEILSGTPAKTCLPRVTLTEVSKQTWDQVITVAECTEIFSRQFQFRAEYRRFGLQQASATGFQEFYKLLLSIHRIPGVEVFLPYVDFHGKLFPINSDDSFHRAVSCAQPLLRVILQHKGKLMMLLNLEKRFRWNYTLVSDIQKLFLNVSEVLLVVCVPPVDDEPRTFMKNKKGLGAKAKAKPCSGLLIGPPMDFHLVSSIIDVDILPEALRRVRLHKHSSNKTMGFYIRDGQTVRITPQGVEKVSGIFISRVVPGGLAASTGLLSVNDEVVEVNGIKVAGKSLDQVTDMMVANSHCLVITVKPANQCNSMAQLSTRFPDSAHSPASKPQLINSAMDGECDNEEHDIIIETDGLSSSLPVPAVVSGHNDQTDTSLSPSLLGL